MPKNGEEFVFPFTDGSVKMTGRRLGIRKINYVQEDPARGEVRNDVLQGESDGSQLSDNKRVTQKSEMISGVFLGIIFIVITFNLDLKSICQKKCHSFKAVDRGFPSSHNIERKASKIDYIVVQRKNIDKSAGNIQSRLRMADFLVEKVEKQINKMKNGTGRMKRRSPTVLES